MRFLLQATEHESGRFRLIQEPFQSYLMSASEQATASIVRETAAAAPLRATGALAAALLALRDSCANCATVVHWLYFEVHRCRRRAVTPKAMTARAWRVTINPLPGIVSLEHARRFRFLASPLRVSRSVVLAGFGPGVRGRVVQEYAPVRCSPGACCLGSPNARQNPNFPAARSLRFWRYRITLTSEEREQLRGSSESERDPSDG